MEGNNKITKAQDQVLPTQLVDDVKRIVERGLREVYLSAVYPKEHSPRNFHDYRQFYLYFKDLEIWNSRVPNDNPFCN